MSATATISRKLALSEFPAFARNLHQTLTAAGIAPRDLVATCAGHVSARCVACGTKLDGRELAALVTGEELPEGSALNRIPHGYCKDDACKSNYYQFTFVPHPSVDWAGIESTGPAASAEAPPPSSWFAALVRLTGRKLAEALTWRLAAGLAVLLALWIWRQWWTGGSIPFLREARIFTSEGVGPEPMTDDDDPK